MKLSKLGVFGLGALTVFSGLFATQAVAQNEQFIPHACLSYRSLCA